MGVVFVAVVRLVDSIVHLVAGGVEDVLLESPAVGKYIYDICDENDEINGKKKE